MPGSPVTHTALPRPLASSSVSRRSRIVSAARPTGASGPPASNRTSSPPVPRAASYACAISGVTRRRPPSTFDRYGLLKFVRAARTSRLTPDARRTDRNAALIDPPGSPIRAAGYGWKRPAIAQIFVAPWGGVQTGPDQRAGDARRGTTSAADAASTAGRTVTHGVSASGQGPNQ